jgi:hydroxyacylglutathione hydrolase
LRVIRYNVGPLDNNTYLLVDETSGSAAIVDPSFESTFIWDEIVANGWTLQWVLNTHAHIDHVIENAIYVQKSGAPLALHPDDLGLLRAMQMQADWMGMEPPAPCEPTHLLADREQISVGGSVVTVTCTPGHSPGSVSFVGEGFVISGDALFAGSIGRTDLPGGDSRTLLRSIQDRLLCMPDETVVYPGHGQTTTIGQERRGNPFLASE